MKLLYWEKKKNLHFVIFKINSFLVDLTDRRNIKNIQSCGAGAGVAKTIWGPGTRAENKC